MRETGEENAYNCYVIAKVIYFVVLLFLIVFALYEFVLPKIISAILFHRPMFLVFPKKKEGRILKKYFKGRIVDAEDAHIIHELSLMETMKIGIHETES